MDCWWTLVLSVLAGVLGVFYNLYRSVNYFKRHGIPYVKATPLLGNMEPNVFGKMSFAENVQRLYNAQPDVKYVGIFDFLTPVVMLRDPELIKSVTIKNFAHFQNHRNFISEVLDPLLAKNLFFLEGKRWRDMRALLSPAFTSSKMKMMFKLVSQCGTELADYLTKQAVEPIEMEMKDIFTRYTNDVIATSAFGLSVNSLTDRENEFYKIGKEATDFSGVRTAKVFFVKCSHFLARLFNVKLIGDKISNFLSHTIELTIAMRNEKGIVRNDMIQLMLQARYNNEKMKLSALDMTAQAFIFFFAGFDTSSTLICFAAHEVGINPDVQEKLQAEIDVVLEECEGEVIYEVLHGMQYLNAVLNEALRLHPPVPLMDRLCTKSIKLPPAAPGLPSFTIKAGTILWVPLHGLQRDPKHFPDPERFDPERFCEENKGSIPPSAFIPFGLGPRSCIANRFSLMEAKLALFHLFAKCNLSPCSRTSIPMVLDKKNVNTTAEKGFWLTVQRRI